jgi:hypothetical protein
MDKYSLLDKTSKQTYANYSKIHEYTVAFYKILATFEMYIYSVVHNM